MNLKNSEAISCIKINRKLLYVDCEFKERQQEKRERWNNGVQKQNVKNYTTMETVENTHLDSKDKCKLYPRKR